MKRTFKKSLSVILAALMLICSVPFAGSADIDLPDIVTLFAPKAEAATSGTCGENLTWTFDEISGILEISGSGEMNYYDPLNERYSPWNSYCNSIKSVVLPDGITSIGSGAFSDCKNIVSMTIPESVTSIGGHAFWNCTSLTNITIPNSVTNIGGWAFGSCKSLVNVTIPNSVTSIGKRAFVACSDLKKITVDSGNTAYSSDENGVLFDKGKTVLICYPVKGSTENYTIPNTVKTIDDFAFYMAFNLKNVTIPNGVTRINNSAFSGASLVSLTIPDSVTFIDRTAFLACTELETLNIGKGTPRIDGSFGGCYSLKSVFIPETLKSIGNYTFYDCSDIENVYYAGSESEWKQIEIYGHNEDLTSAKIHYNISITESFDVSTVKTPSTSTINYGDAIILRVDESKIPEGGTVEWTASNNNFKWTANGATCEISPEKSGNTTFTATIYDAGGNSVASDIQTMTSKAGFFQKIIAFFKGIFGLNKTFPNVFKF